MSNYEFEIVDKNQKSIIPILFLEDYELESAKLFYSKQDEEEYWYKHEMNLLYE